MHSSIGLAISHDGRNFKKQNEINPIINSRSLEKQQCVTPAVFTIGDLYYMVFSIKPFGKGRRLCIAYADDIKGSWHFGGDLIKPELSWEGNDIDIGPSVAKINEAEVLIYFSNVSSKRNPFLFLNPNTAVGKLVH